MRQLRQKAVWAMGAIAIMLPLQFLGATAAQAQPASFTPLTLVNGWANAPFGTSNAAVTNIFGIVHLKGAIKTFSTNTNMVPFILPAGARPDTKVFVPVDLCNANEGRLFIKSTGVVRVQAETALSDARCFTSLDGASFASSGSSFTPLTLVNGWANAPFGTSKAAVRIINGIVHFKGAIKTVSTNTNMVPFTLPAGFRPHTNVYIPVDLCNANKGRLFIQPRGVVTVQAEGNNVANARCFTSLDGASFAP
jgi:hypothetical protein